MKKILRNEKALIDLGSIMVGVIVLGIMSAIVGATIFAIIPWVQDNNAKQALSALTVAQNGFDQVNGNYGNYTTLTNQKLAPSSPLLCAATYNNSQGYILGSKSLTGKIFVKSTANPDVHILQPNESGCMDSLGNPSTTPLAASNAGRMVITWDPSLAAACKTVTFPINGNVNALVDWGDGTQTLENSDNPTHTYTTTTPETVTIAGTFDAFKGYYGTPPANWTPACVTGVTKWTGTNTTNATGAFQFASNLTKFTEIPSTLTNLSAMLSSATKFNDPSVSNWDVSNVTSIANLFGADIAFNQPLNSWNTANVTNMSLAFSSALAFNQPLSNWNTTKVTDMNNMFANAAAFNQPLSTWKTSNVTTLYGTFNGASTFNQDISSWDVSKVTNLSYTFAYARAFNSPLNTWNTANVTTLLSTFANASVFNQPLSNWQTTKVTTMDSTFYNAAKFNQNVNTNISLNSWNVSNVTNMDSTFSNAVAFNQPLNSWNTAKVTSMNATFGSASVFNQSLSAWKLTSVTDTSYMFWQAYAFNQPLSAWSTATVTNMTWMFNKATVFNQNISGWSVAAAKNSTDTVAFSQGSALTTANSPKW